MSRSFYDPVSSGLRRLWARTLEIPEEEAGSGFLGSGGDSLRALELQAAIEQELGVRLPLPRILAAQSPDDLVGLEGMQTVRRNEPVQLTYPGAETTLSFSQERLAYLHDLSSATSAYVVAQATSFRGSLDRDALRRALFAACARHDSLRLTLRITGGQLVPLWNRPATPAWREVRWPGTASAGEFIEALDAYLGELANAPIDRQNGPLLHATLVHVTADHHVLLLAAHHAVADHWAMEVLWRELARAWRDTRESRAPTFEEPAPSFRALAAAQRRALSAARRRALSRFWVDQLRDAVPTTLTEDFPRPAEQSFAGRRLTLPLSAQDILRIRSVAAARKVTPATLLLATFMVLLQRYVGGRDVTVGVPVAGRQMDRARDAVGALVNTVVVRTEFATSDGFAAALSRVRDSLFAALDHGDWPFDELVRTLDPPRNPGGPPYFSVMFNLVDTLLPIPEFAGLAAARIEFDKQSAQCDLQLTVDLRQTRSVSFEYASKVFRQDTIARFARQYLELLRHVLSGRAFDEDLMGLQAEERRQLLDWGRGPPQERDAGSIGSLLAERMPSLGARTAVVCGDSVLTYESLWQRSGQLALALQTTGIGRGSRVGICMTRSPSLLVAVLGVLRAGAAYVPLDPAFPTERLAYMIGDAGIALTLVDESARHENALHPATGEIQTIEALSSGTSSPSAPPVDELPRPLPHDPAYVIYTSGSTGQPKGVVICHGAVTNFLRSMQQVPGLGPDDRLLAVTTLSFDISVLELLLPLSVGARIIVAQTEQVRDPLTLISLMQRHDVTVMQATPSTWRALLDAGWQGHPRLKALVGGETLAPNLASRLLERVGELWNMYGPTETTVWSTCHRVASAEGARIPIGRPIANTHVLVLDESMQPCPIGAPGEIYIAGDGLAQGYWGLPELTAARFIANPNSRDRRTMRMYRTGDRGRWRADGLLEHLGRADTQVKVRGHRIEIGEVEATLARHPDVREAVVVAVVERADDVTLVGYLVARSGTLDVDAVRTHAERWLPRYMLPQLLIEVDSIPLLPNGKIDRRRLPSPRQAARGRGELLAPRNDVERALREIWATTLGHDRFGVQDDFFEVGGHSLLAVRVAALVRERLRRHCSVSLLLHHPTIEKLSMALERVETAPGPLPIVLNGHPGPATLYCLCGINIYSLLAERLCDLVRVAAVFVPEEMAALGQESDPESLASAASIPTLASWYRSAILEAQPAGPFMLAGFSLGGVIALEVAQQLRAAGHEVRLLVLLDSDVPGSAGRGRSGLATLLRRFVKGAHAERQGSQQNRYQQMMQNYSPTRYDAPAFYVKSSEPPAWDSGGRWEDLLSSIRSVAVDCSHMEIVESRGMAEWLDPLRQTLLRAMVDE